MIKFSVPIEPVTFKRVRTCGSRHFNDPKYSAAKEMIGLFARRAMQGQPPLRGAIKIKVEVFSEREPTSLSFGDWDNHAKAVSDALNGICYSDDRQIVEGHVHLIKGSPHISIILEEVSNEIYQHQGQQRYSLR